MKRITLMTLRDGKYFAMCKERNALAAAASGHGPIYPSAPCTIAKGVAVFLRGGKEVWRGNAAYAETYFKLESLG